MNKNSNTILITFDSVFNIHLGLINLIKENFNNDKFMNVDLFNNDDEFFKMLLLTTKETNPLKLLLKEDKLNQADSIYNAFMDKEYNNILKNASVTGIYGLILTYLKTGEGLIKPKVLCKNELEQQYINQLNISIPTVIGELDKIDLSQFSSIFIKDIRDLLKIENLEGKNIFVLSYLNNFEEDNKTLLMEVLIRYGDLNEFRVANAYPDIKQPAG